MGRKIGSYFISAILIITIPYAFTMIINGNRMKLNERVNSLNTGRDVIVHFDDGNKLLDVEQYLAGVLPGIIDPNSDDSLIEAEAVSVRTAIITAMGDDTVIDSDKIDYRYYTEEEREKRWGRIQYRICMMPYLDAIIKTAGVIIK